MNDEPIDDSVRLDELDKVEWRDVSKALKPEMTDEQFDIAWAEFCRLKALKGMQ